MALFYPHVKGGATDSDASSTTKIKYTWLRFNGNGENPSLYISKLNQTDYTSDHAVNCGYLVTTNKANAFTQTQYLRNGSHLVLSSSDVNPTSYAMYVAADGNTKKFFIDDAETSLVHLLESYSDSNNKYTKLTGRFTTTDSLIIGNVAGASSNKSLYVERDGNIGNACNALFFNATSDKRAKTNIDYLDIDALDLINKVRIYSFDYKDTYESSIGVIAQELEDLDIQGFSLVDNIYASGKDGDYMRVKETKLIYILWKGVQDLSEEVKNLRLEIERLKFER